METAKPHPSNLTPGFNRFMYGLTLLVSLYYIFLSKDFESAMSTLGIGLIFDPFKQEVSWVERPFYQKAILLVHLSVVFILLGFVLFKYLS